MFGKIIKVLVFCLIGSTVFAGDTLSFSFTRMSLTEEVKEKICLGQFTEMNTKQMAKAAQVKPNGFQSLYLPENTMRVIVSYSFSNDKIKCVVYHGN